MDLKKNGAFIAQLRKEQDLTQTQLAALLGVSDKAISRWETGKGMPDTSLLQPLSQTLGVSVGELLSGERLGEDAVQKTDRVILDAMARSGRTILITGLLLLSLIGAVLVLSPLYMVGKSYWASGVILLFTATLLWLRLQGAKALMAPCAVAFLILALVLEAIPGGVALVFAAGPDEQVVEVFSCFSLTPLGYANVTPFVTALLTALLIGFWPFAMQGPDAGRAMSICLLAASLLSVMPVLFFGRAYMTPQSWAISAALASAAVTWLSRKAR